MPSIAEIRREAQLQASPWRKELQRIHDVLSAKVIPTRKLVDKSKFEALKAELAQAAARATMKKGEAA